MLAQDLNGDGRSISTATTISHHPALVPPRGQPPLNTAFSGNEADAMGEGGSDFFAYSVNGDTTLAEYALPGGLRSINGKTYADWVCFFGLFCPPHENGQIFANVLWDLRERLRTDLVGGSEAVAINESHQLYVDALTLSPPAPTMLDMRDAMLLADDIRNPGSPDSTNFCRIWESFAARGMASAPWIPPTVATVRSPRLSTCPQDAMAAPTTDGGTRRDRRHCHGGGTVGRIVHSEPRYRFEHRARGEFDDWGSARTELITSSPRRSRPYPAALPRYPSRSPRLTTLCSNRMKRSRSPSAMCPVRRGFTLVWHGHPCQR